MKLINLLILSVSLISLGINTSFAQNEVEATIIFENGYNIKEPEGIDMGGSVLWASFNLFAEKPEDNGIYCGWGDPSGELKFQSDEPEEENYIDLETCLAMFGGLEPSSNISGSDIDIAARFLKNGWKLPSYTDFGELHDCKWELTRIDGNLGYLVTADNGNSIFLPAWNNEIVDVEGLESAYGAYWTSSLSHYPNFYSEENNACALCLNLAVLPWWLRSDDYDLPQIEVGDSIAGMDWPRWAQLMIRPVKSKNNILKW